jgi:hypothetical protein
MSNSLEVHAPLIVTCESYRVKTSFEQCVVDLSADLRAAQEILLRSWILYSYYIEDEDCYWNNHEDNSEEEELVNDLTALILAWGLIEEHPDHKGWYRVVGGEK